MIDLKIPETALALNKRFEFIAEAIKVNKPENILDIGCGTGEQLTKYIAEAFPKINILGLDDDIKTIQTARELNSRYKNLKFSEKIAAGKKFDLIIASEVIEHVKKPVEFLDMLNKMLNKNGILILTLPNGYSYFELIKILEFVFIISGVIPFLKFIKNTIIKKKKSKQNDTEAVSPHINFFSYKQIIALLKSRGFEIAKYCGRMFLYGFIVTNIINLSRFLIKINIKLGEKFNPALVTDWMFVLRKSNFTSNYKYKRNFYSRLKIWINLKLWKLDKNYLSE